MVWVPPPSGKRGRQQNYSDAAIQACLTLKVLFGLPLRQTTGFVQSLLQLIGLDRAVPDFSTLCRRQRTLNVSLPYRGGTGPLNLLIDSTGIKAEGEGEWNARKHGVLGQAELVHALAIVNLRGGFKPIRAVSKEDPVEIEFKNLLFIQCSFYLDGQQNLIEFAHDQIFVWREVIERT